MVPAFSASFFAVKQQNQFFGCIEYKFTESSNQLICNSFVVKCAQFWITIRMKQFAYLFFILAFQVLLIGSCISGGIGNSLSKSLLTPYYVDLNLLNQPASLKKNVFNQSCWWNSGWHQHPLILIFCEISLKHFQTLKATSVSDCRVFPLQYLWHALPLPLVLSSTHSKINLPHWK